MDSDINYIAKTTNFSTDVVYILTQQYGIKRAESLIKAIKKPVEWYSLRVNTLKISQEKLAEIFRNEGLTVKADNKLPEVIYLKVEGPFTLPDSDKKVVADKFRS